MIDTEWTDENGKVIVEPKKMIKAIQEQQEQIETLKAEIQELKG